ncbi:MAG: hypothetical protein ACI8YD_001381, partial [Rheinheimera aquimaris]
SAPAETEKRESKRNVITFFTIVSLSIYSLQLGRVQLLLGEVAIIVLL